MWQLTGLEVQGGFLPNLKIDFPFGLTCIIGPRGSGKSTLVELIRFAFRGTVGLSKVRLDLLQSNLGTGGLIVARIRTDVGISYTLSRGLRQSPLITTEDGRPIDTLDLDRGTFLPLDVFSSSDIESIADETLGNKRRALLDDLRVDDLQDLQLRLNEKRRALDANADLVKAKRRAINDLLERIEDLSDAPARLAAMGAAPESAPATDYSKASRQQQFNEAETERFSLAVRRLASLAGLLDDLSLKIKSESNLDLVEAGSANALVVEAIAEVARRAIHQSALEVDSAKHNLLAAHDTLLRNDDVKSRHAAQRIEFARLAEANDASSALIRARAALEQQVGRLEQLRAQKLEATVTLDMLLSERSAMRASFLALRDDVSLLRQSIADTLQVETGPNVRIRVIRHADDLAYRQTLLESLRGARVRNHEDILRSLLTLRPDQLAQIIDGDDFQEFEHLMSFGPERSRRILDALRDHIDPFALELTPIEDRIRIELNVATGADVNYKDASELSRGQKCTALLPLLLARTNNPLIIDQPEDNLDNHFIYETVVSSIVRRKIHRQMIFITHNANIPVLADATLVISMNSDGKIGYVEASGTVDGCRDEIIDLLEGGEEAFARRSRRYAGG